MRTTVTLDPDVETLINTAMREREVSFKEAVNEAIRAGLAPQPGTAFHQRTFAMGFRADISYDKALQIAAALENQELLHKLALGK
ncbi:MAG: ribbon-helix-helix domain-containing protein [Chloroflexota bacterium]